MRLKCPVCGQTPLFTPLAKTRSLNDWFSPLDGCPRCGYPYEREPGYFLLAIWAINYGCGSVLGITIYIVLEVTTKLPLTQLITAVLVPVVLFNFFFARHSKALFLALDHFCDPHVKDGGDEGGNKPNEPPPDVNPPRPAVSPVNAPPKAPAKPGPLVLH